VTRRERGQVTVEFALLLPVVVLVALAIIQIALVARDQLALTHAAREAARAASVNPDPGAAEAAAHRTVPDAHVRVTDRPEVGEEIGVVVVHVSKTDLPLIGPLIPDVTQVAGATMRVEK
jgi:Flp pilus assembly protein TadG